MTSFVSVLHGYYVLGFFWEWVNDVIVELQETNVTLWQAMCETGNHKYTFSVLYTKERRKEGKKERKKERGRKRKNNMKAWT